MTGYCETCETDAVAKPDEFGVMVCKVCDTDLVFGIHTDDEEEYDEDECLDECCNYDEG